VAIFWFEPQALWVFLYAATIKAEDGVFRRTVVIVEGLTIDGISNANALGK
jgi:hypothetical protein